MEQYLCVSATFLDTLFHGRGDSDEPEWPPSPLRLFQALLAGARIGCRNSKWTRAKGEAFRWLETQRPPAIMAPDARPTAGYTFFVPVNDGDRVANRANLLAPKVASPSWLLGGDTVHYLWRTDSDDSEAQRHTEILCREARHMLSLGWGIDQVVGNGRVLTETEASVLPGRRWRPLSMPLPGAPMWRVPAEGSLGDLNRVHLSFLGRVEGNQCSSLSRLKRFNTVSYLGGATLPPRSWAVFESPDSVAFHQEDAAKVAAMLRSLTARQAKSDTHQFPGGSETYVAGHTGKQDTTPPRFSYLPLPTIGHENADGMVRRYLIAEPYAGSGKHARWAQGRLRGALLVDKNGHERGVLLDPWRGSSKYVIGHYLNEARSWSTVTPVVLPGYDDHAQTKAEKLLYTALCQAGLPQGCVTDMTIRKAPFWPGSRHPDCYFLPDYLRGMPGWHVRLLFRDPIRGPLALGAGRHIGLGLFARTGADPR